MALHSPSTKPVRGNTPVNATSGMISYKTVKFKSEDSLYKYIKVKCQK